MPTGPTPLDKNPPGSNQHPLSSKEEARTSDKEKPRVEDGALDGVAARTATEHLAVKQEPHIPSVSVVMLALTWIGERDTSSVPLWRLKYSWRRKCGAPQSLEQDWGQPLAAVPVQVGDGVMASALSGGFLGLLSSSGVPRETPGVPHSHTCFCFGSPNRHVWCHQ